jgi:hypothetical protein
VEDRERSARSAGMPNARDAATAVGFAALTPLRLARLGRTPRALRQLVEQDVRPLAVRRPAPTAWSAVEVVCHLRDIEEAYVDRIRFMVLNDRPVLIQLDPDRWAEDRQYARCDLADAVAAFRARREDTLAFLDSLAPDQWERAADHPARGRLTIRRVVHSLASHDVEHLDQIARALAGHE